MDSGGVELSGAVDYTPDKEPVEKKKTVESVEKIATEDIHFRASDIEKKDNKELFEKPADKKRREREEKRRINAEAKQILRDAKKKKKVSGASESVQQAEKALKDEQGRIAANQRAEKAGKFFGVFFGGWKKYVTIGALVLLIGGVTAWYFCIYRPDVERNEQISLLKKDLEAENKANEFLNQTISDMLDNLLNDGKDVERALELFDAEIANASREEKIFLEFSRVMFSISYVEGLELDDDGQGNISVNEEEYKKEIKRFSGAVEGLLKTDYEKKGYYEQMSSLYEGFDKQKANEYEQKVKGIGDVYCNLGMEECEK